MARLSMNSRTLKNEGALMSPGLIQASRYIAYIGNLCFLALKVCTRQVPELIELANTRVVL